MGVQHFGADRARARSILVNLATQHRSVRLTFVDANKKKTVLRGTMKRVNGDRVTVNRRGADEWASFSDLTKIETI